MPRPVVDVRDGAKIGFIAYGTTTWALEESRELADARHPEIESKKERQFLTYREDADEELFKVERVEVEYGEMDMPGRPR